MDTNGRKRMKKSEMAVLVAEYLLEPKSDDLMVQATQIIERMEKYGILPPVNDCKLVPHKDGGTKHSPSKREWEPE